MHFVTNVEEDRGSSRGTQPFQFSKAMLVARVTSAILGEVCLSRVSHLVVGELES